MICRRKKLASDRIRDFDKREMIHFNRFISTNRRRRRLAKQFEAWIQFICREAIAAFFSFQIYFNLRKSLWMWQSWQSGRFRYQRTGFEFSHRQILLNVCLLFAEKSKIKKKRPGMAHKRGNLVAVTVKVDGFQFHLLMGVLLWLLFFSFSFILLLPFANV